MFELALSPAGHLRCIEYEQADANASSLSQDSAKRIGKAFEKDQAEGLLHLETACSQEDLGPVFTYWRNFAAGYLSQLCHIPEGADVLLHPIAMPGDELSALLASAPPMRGGEYLREQTLEQLWSQLDAHVRDQIADFPGGLSAWLRKRSPLWHCVGRVCFHLAENKRDSQYPFAFMATYAPKLLDGDRIKYRPLGKALEEYAGAANKNALVKLLTPVDSASQRCSWVKTLVESGDLFHPLAWSPHDAWQLLRDIPQLEASGLVVRVPDWWRKRSPRVRVGVSIGQKKQSMFSADAMLDFNVELTLDGEQLSEAERRQILSSGDGLVFLKGRWVEVDKEKLAAAMDHWQRVEQEVGDDGVSFIQGMRLLAGATPDLADELDEQTAAWSDIHAGKWLAKRLDELRQPNNGGNRGNRGSQTSLLPGKMLHATLRPYQETGVQWLHLMTGLGLGGCLADDMGLGKTIQVLALLLLLKRQKKTATTSPALLVLPASLLANWKAEIEQFAPSLVVCFVHPSQTTAQTLKRATNNPKVFVKGADAVLTTYGMLLRQPWLSELHWSLIVLDEAQAVKNPSARQTRIVKKLKADARLALTGTPVENRLTDLWSIFDFLCPGLLGNAKTFGGFVKRIEASSDNPYAPLRKLVGPYILRRLKTDKSIINDLPDKTEVQAYCTLTKQQAVLYEQSVHELGHTLKTVDGIERRGTVLAFIMRFKQICNHPAQWLGSNEYTPQHSGKFQRLRQIAEEIASRQEKVLVFTQYREITAPLAGFLQEVFGRPGAVLHGGTAVRKRKKLIDDFQREDGPPFFVLSLKAGGTGLNLTAASHVIHFDRWWNPAVENQATDRAFRIGQKRNVMVHKFVCQGTVEEKIDAMIRQKTQLAGELLEAGTAKILTQMDDRELLDMVRLDINTAKGNGDVL